MGRIDHCQEIKTQMGICCSIPFLSGPIYCRNLDRFYATDGTADLGFKEAVSCLAFASIGMIITPGGIGAYAFLLAKVLEQNDVTYAIGIANGTLQWFAQCIIVLVVGGFCLVLLPFYNKQKKDESS
jgi:NhaP-type Na+/H+ and K+/H+ antiporter